MKHGYECKCPGCAIGRAIGMIKKSVANDKSCSCGSGRSYRDCCGGESSQGDNSN